MRALLLTSMLGVVATTATSARAGEPASAVAPAEVAPEVRAAAKSHSDRGRRFYEIGEYARAIDAYREAYMILPSPGVLFNLGYAPAASGRHSAERCPGTRPQPGRPAAGRHIRLGRPPV